MTLKQQIHALVEELPDDPSVASDIRETLRMSHAIGQAMADVREGRTYGADEFLAKVEQRWPVKDSA